MLSFAGLGAWLAERRAARAPAQAGRRRAHEEPLAAGVHEFAVGHDIEAGIRQYPGDPVDQPGLIGTGDAQDVGRLQRAAPADLKVELLRMV